jgi:hypothetical protein
VHPHAASPPLPPPPHRAPLGINGGPPEHRRPPPCRPFPSPLLPIKGAPGPPLHPAPLPLFSPRAQRRCTEGAAGAPPRRPDLLRRRLFLGSEPLGEFIIALASF